MSGEILEITAKCGGCKKKVKPENFSFEVSAPESCDACGGGSRMYLEYDWPGTCMCSPQDKTVEFTCPKCEFYNEVEIH